MVRKYIMKDGKTVYIFCKENDLPYSNVCRSIRYYIQKWSGKDLGKIIEHVVSRYLSIYEYKHTIKFINNLDVHNCSLLLISKTLNIEYSAMYKLLKYNFSKIESFYIVWFLHDKISKNGKITITKKQINKFLTFYNEKVTDSKFNFMFIMVLIKFGNRRAVDYLLDKREKSILKIIRKNIFVDNYFENNKDDIKNEIFLNESLLYKKICLNNIEQIMRYLNISAKYTVIKYVKNDKEKSFLHLDDQIYDSKNRYEFLC